MDLLNVDLAFQPVRSSEQGFVQEPHYLLLNYSGLVSMLALHCTTQHKPAESSGTWLTSGGSFVLCLSLIKFSTTGHCPYRLRGLFCKLRDMVGGEVHLSPGKNLIVHRYIDEWHENIWSNNKIKAWIRLVEGLLGPFLHSKLNTWRTISGTKS